MSVNSNGTQTLTQSMNGILSFSDGSGTTIQNGVIVAGAIAIDSIENSVAGITTNIYTTDLNGIANNGIVNIGGSQVHITGVIQAGSIYASNTNIINATTDNIQALTNTDAITLYTNSIGNIALGSASSTTTLNGTNNIGGSTTTTTLNGTNNIGSFTTTTTLNGFNNIGSAGKTTTLNGTTNIGSALTTTTLNGTNIMNNISASASSATTNIYTNVLTGGSINTGSSTSTTNLNGTINLGTNSSLVNIHGDTHIYGTLSLGGAVITGAVAMDNIEVSTAGLTTNIYTTDATGAINADS